MTEATKLRDLIHVTKADIEAAIAAKAKDDGAVAQAAGQAGGFAASIAADQLNSVLDTDLYELLALTWAKGQQLKEAASKSRLKPVDTIVETLGKHELTHTCYPTLTIFIGEVPLPEIKLTLELVAQFRSVSLSIANGLLLAIAPGQASAIVRLKYNGVKIKEQATPDWKLPGEIKLGAGLMID